MRNILCLFGLSGSGKTTLCRALQVKWRFERISPSSRIDAIKAGEQSCSNACRKILQTSQRLPDSVFIDLVLSALRESSASRIVFDGFPRTLLTLDAFTTEVKRLRIPEHVIAGLHLTVSESLAAERFLNRKEKLSRRESFDQRILHFRNHELPTIREFQKRYKLIETNKIKTNAEIEQFVEKFLSIT